MTLKMLLLDLSSECCWRL